MNGNDVSEREKFERELGLKEADLALKRSELDLKREEQARATWRNPLVLGLAAAIIGLLGNVFVAAVNGSSERALDSAKADSNLILEAIKTGSPDAAAENLKLLVDMIVN
jgi:hypothetical protein